MDKNSKYYHISKTKHLFSLSDRLTFSWKEIFIYPLAIFFLLLSTFGTAIFAIPITLMVFTIYTIFRKHASIFYKILEVNLDNGKVYLIKKRINTIVSKEEIDKTFDFNKITFENQTRSGKTKYILNYTTYKTYSILVIKSEAHKMHIEQEFRNILD